MNLELSDADLYLSKTAGSRFHGGRLNERKQSKVEDYGGSFLYDTAAFEEHKRPAREHFLGETFRSSASSTRDTTGGLRGKGTGLNNSFASFASASSSLPIPPPHWAVGLETKGEDHVLSPNKGTRVRLHRSGDVDITVNSDTINDIDDIDDISIDSRSRLNSSRAYSFAGSEVSGREYTSRKYKKDPSSTHYPTSLGHENWSSKPQSSEASTSGRLAAQSGGEFVSKPLSPVGSTTGFPRTRGRVKEHTSPYSGGAPSTRSAAVISAMNALQDKARLLERDLDAERDKSRSLRIELQRSHEKSERLSERCTVLENQLRDEKAGRAKAEGVCEEQSRQAENTSAMLESAQSGRLEVESRLQTQVVELQGRLDVLTKQAAQSTRELEDKIEALELESGALKEKLESERVRRSKAEENHSEAEAFMHNLAQINQNLVSKLANHGASSPCRSQSQGTTGSKLRRKKRSGTSSKTKSGGGPVLHTARRSGRKGVSPRAGTAKATPRVRKSRSESIESIDKQLIRANLGRSVPFLLGRNPGPTFSVYGIAQSALADDKAYGRRGDRGEEQARGNDELSDSESTQMPYYEEVLNKSHNDVDDYGAEPSDDDVGGVIMSLRTELEALKTEYDTILQGLSREEVSNGIDAEMREKMTSLVERIEKKAEQLRSVEKIRDHLSEKQGRSPIRSPKAYGRKVETLKALNSFRRSALAD